MKVLICGTKYGQTYLSLFLKETPGFELAGILARGSEQSRKFADGFKVPLYTDTDQLPSDIDIACVAVRATIMGGDGTRLALALMDRGIHVIQEHPLHPGDVRKCLDRAKHNGVSYHINSHFLNLEPVETFMDYLKKAMVHETPLYIEASTSLSYSLLDILGNVMGGLAPYGFSKAVTWDEALTARNSQKVIPFQCLQGIISGVPLTLKFQNFYDSKTEMDDSLLLLHRICVGLPSGNLTLLNPHGPIIWSIGHVIQKYGGPEILFGKDKNRVNTKDKDAMPTAISFSPPTAPSWDDIVTRHWPRGILTALNKMKTEIQTTNPCPGQEPAYLMELSQAWMTLTRSFGTPNFTRLKPPGEPKPDPREYQKTCFAPMIP
ncbi:MAG: Gfo/Idh/MocA family oxidoreductase [Desulfobacterales bacterium]|nr:Gfo/Idh/MocA family oxidoreductase [Desulfobacterales bacterium]